MKIKRFSSYFSARHSVYFSVHLPTLSLILGALIVVFTMTGCSTVTVNERTPLPEVPDYVRVPHPTGYEMVDLKATLLSPLAPKGVLGEFADTCDDEFKKLISTTMSREDRRKGAEELVTRDPERIHWCFYSKISRLNDVLSSDATWSARQKKVLETYDFLSPIANAYVAIYQDSRYIRWASVYYTKISEWVFFRKVTPGPENTMVLIDAQRSDLEPWVPVKDTGQTTGSVFQKYGIDLAPSAKQTMNPVAENAQSQNGAPMPATAPIVASEKKPAPTSAVAPATPPSAPKTALTTKNTSRAPASVPTAPAAPAKTAPIVPTQQVPVDQAPKK